LLSCPTDSFVAKSLCLKYWGRTSQLNTDWHNIALSAQSNSQL
jgi:hypothetical protein